MLIRDAIRWIAVSLLSQRQRSFLTALGIAVGITAVALLTSVGEGLRVYLLDTFSAFGTRLVAVTSGKATTHGMEGILKTIRPLTEYDVEELRKLPYIEAITPVVQGTVKVENYDKQRDIELMGVGYEAAKAWRFEVAIGRFLPPDDSAMSRPYAVLGSTVRRELFGDENPLGKTLRVGGYRFRVIGAMKSKGQMLGFDLDDVVYIPSNRASQILNREGLSQINIVFSEKTTSDEMSQRVRRQLTQLHGEEDFTLQTQEDMLNSLDKILRIITLSIAGLGAISLLVGGVGVTTIMTTSLHERMQEIGLLRALGATRQQTLLLFLGEAIVLSMLGGIAGVLLVIVLVATATSAVPGLPLTLQPMYLLMALALSIIVGLVAGISPAWRASLLDPISALRQH
jgi:putative ABC transport system permease protein